MISVVLDPVVHQLIAHIDVNEDLSSVGRVRNPIAIPAAACDLDSPHDLGRELWRFSNSGKHALALSFESFSSPALAPLPFDACSVIGPPNPTPLPKMRVRIR